jgi:hypothetical protein
MAEVHFVSTWELEDQPRGAQASKSASATTDNGSSASHGFSVTHLADGGGGGGDDDDRLPAHTRRELYWQLECAEGEVDTRELEALFPDREQHEDEYWRAYGEQRRALAETAYSSGSAARQMLLEAHNLTEAQWRREAARERYARAMRAQHQHRPRARVWKPRLPLDEAARARALQHGHGCAAHGVHQWQREFGAFYDCHVVCLSQCDVDGHSAARVALVLLDDTKPFDRAYAEWLTVFGRDGGADDMRRFIVFVPARAASALAAWLRYFNPSLLCHAAPLPSRFNAEVPRVHTPLQSTGSNTTWPAEVAQHLRLVARSGDAFTTMLSSTQPTAQRAARQRKPAQPTTAAPVRVDTGKDAMATLMMHRTKHRRYTED